MMSKLKFLNQALLIAGVLAVIAAPSLAQEGTPLAEKEAVSEADTQSVPFFVFDEQGGLFLTELAVDSDLLIFGGECSGGQCVRHGVVLTCPSGGTTCEEGTSCSCNCNENGSTSHSCEPSLE